MQVGLKIREILWGVQSIFKITASAVIYILISLEFYYKRALKFLALPLITRTFLWLSISAYIYSGPQKGFKQSSRNMQHLHFDYPFNKNFCVDWSNSLSESKWLDKSPQHFSNHKILSKLLQRFSRPVTRLLRKGPCTGLFGKLTVALLAKRLSVLYLSRKFITVLTYCCHRSTSSAGWIQSQPTWYIC
jgi:hypothetical protein